MILVTGATGFVGTALVARLRADGRRVRPTSRRSLAGYVPVGMLDAMTDWSVPLEGVDAVVHLAARVHVMRDDARDPLAAFRATNVDATIHLAKQAAQRGVRRFVFVSSVKVNGETTFGEAAFNAEDKPAPVDPYGVSKREAEEALLELARETGMEVTIIRPPLVYGPGVGGNFKSMLEWLQRGVPLPLGAVRNKRTLVALDNLIDLVVICIDHPAAANQVFLVGDPEDLSTPELLRRLARAMDVPIRLIPIPVSLLRLGAALFGKRAVAQRLCGSLRVDTAKTRNLLGWTPPVPVDEGLRKVAAHFMEQRRQ
ncbi:MAG: SDR family oxidoreductase [Burkholderiaceae bacterium]|nr:SDR family oxidoreductase [Burkholderiaceae bacterium]